MIHNCQQRSNITKKKSSPKKRLVQVGLKNSSRQANSQIGRTKSENKKKGSLKNKLIYQNKITPTTFRKFLSI